jgi:hypothetical protein
MVATCHRAEDFALAGVAECDNPCTGSAAERNRSREMVAKCEGTIFAGATKCYDARITAPVMRSTCSQGDRTEAWGL